MSDKVIKLTHVSRLVDVIQTQFCLGEGTKENPNRTVTVWHEKNGSLIGIKDPAWPDHEECRQKYNELEEGFGKTASALILGQKKHDAAIARNAIKMFNVAETGIDTHLELVAQAIESS